jgi:ribose 1,5-bisphosphate isomerase
MKNYPDILKIYNDIQKLNIQGATNVAIATFEGMKLYVEQSKEKDPQLFYNELLEIADKLANARMNEPLARNGVKFVKYFFKQDFPVLPEINSMRREVYELCDKYLDMISGFTEGGSKKNLVEKCAPLLSNFDKIFTHCHSSTVVALIIELSKGDKNFEVVCTETRPRFQGRTTAKNLLNAGVKTTLIADSAGESFIIGRGSVPIDVVFIGCDQITAKGHAINKIGSWGMGMAAHYGGKPLYVITPLLKIDPDSFHHSVQIEVREDGELWPDAPKGLHMYNPAFEIVDSMLITGYVTEFGILKPSDVDKVAQEKYPWLLEK